jgi:hypothetical protein
VFNRGSTGFKFDLKTQFRLLTQTGPERCTLFDPSNADRLGWKIHQILSGPETRVELTVYGLGRRFWVKDKDIEAKE